MENEQINLIKRKNLKISFTLMLLLSSTQLYAQNVVTFLIPDSSSINQCLLAQCKRDVDSVNSMPLKCDTIQLCNVILYFDTQGQFRKIITNGHGWGAEGGTTTSYYDENGTVVYIERHSHDHCFDTKEHYYLHDGRIVDFSYYDDCSCCEEYEEDVLKEKQEDNTDCRPAIGKLLIDVNGWAKYYISPIHFLNEYYDIYKYSGSQILPGTFPKEITPDLEFLGKTYSYKQQYLGTKNIYLCYKVNSDHNRLTIQIIKDCEKGIMGLKYIYKLTESGFVLEKVE